MSYSLKDDVFLSSSHLLAFDFRTLPISFHLLPVYLNMAEAHISTRLVGLQPSNSTNLYQRTQTSKLITRGGSSGGGGGGGGGGGMGGNGRQGNINASAESPCLLSPEFDPGALNLTVRTFLTFFVLCKILT